MQSRKITLAGNDDSILKGNNISVVHIVVARTRALEQVGCSNALLRHGKLQQEDVATFSSFLGLLILFAWFTNLKGINSGP